MKKMIAVSSLILVISIFGGCKVLPGEDERIVSSKPVISAYFSEERFTVVHPPKQIDGLQMGIVIVKRRSDGICFSAVVIPNRNLTKGTAVELIEISYQQSPSASRDFVMVK